MVRQELEKQIKKQFRDMNDGIDKKIAKIMKQIGVDDAPAEESVVDAENKIDGDIDELRK